MYYRTYQFSVNTVQLVFGEAVQKIVVWRRLIAKQLSQIKVVLLKFCVNLYLAELLQHWQHVKMISIQLTLSLEVSLEANHIWFDSRGTIVSNAVTTFAVQNQLLSLELNKFAVCFGLTINFQRNFRVQYGKNSS